MKRRIIRSFFAFLGLSAIFLSSCSQENPLTNSESNQDDVSSNEVITNNGTQSNLEKLEKLFDEGSALDRKSVV